MESRWRTITLEFPAGRPNPSEIEPRKELADRLAASEGFTKYVGESEWNYTDGRFDLDLLYLNPLPW